MQGVEEEVDTINSKVHLDEDNNLFLQFFLCEKLLHVQEFRNKVTMEELIYWSSYLQLKSEREKAEYDRIERESKFKR